MSRPRQKLSVLDRGRAAGISRMPTRHPSRDHDCPAERQSRDGLTADNKCRGRDKNCPSLLPVDLRIFPQFSSGANWACNGVGTSNRSRGPSSPTFSNYLAQGSRVRPGRGLGRQSGLDIHPVARAELPYLFRRPFRGRGCRILSWSLRYRAGCRRCPRSG
jgi:hypothetical protein